jgi:hypothetical protein
MRSVRFNHRQNFAEKRKILFLYRIFVRDIAGIVFLLPKNKRKKNHFYKYKSINN